MMDLKSFSKIKVLVAGDVMLDRYWWGDVNRISPEAPVPVVRLKGDSTAPGGAANVAANIVGLGATPVLIGAVGDDAEAAELRASLQANGIDPSNLFEVPGKTTIVKTRIIAHGQQVVRIDREQHFNLTDDQEGEVIRRIDGLLPEISAVLISDYGKGLLTERLISYLIAAARNTGYPVLVDPKGKNYRKYAGATLLTPNQREAAEACGLNEEMVEMIDAAGRMMLEEFGVENALITQGERGMTLFQKDEDPHHIPVAALETYDVTGAGDTVIATICVAHAAGAELLEAAKIANIAAGHVVGQVGTTAITLETLAEALRA